MDNRWGFRIHMVWWIHFGGMRVQMMQMWLSFSQEGGRGWHTLRQPKFTRQFYSGVSRSNSTEYILVLFCPQWVLIKQYEAVKEKISYQLPGVTGGVNVSSTPLHMVEIPPLSHSSSRLSYFRIAITWWTGSLF